MNVADQPATESESNDSPSSGSHGQSSGTGSAASASDYEELVRKVTERVLALWREELRRDRERQGDHRR